MTVMSTLRDKIAIEEAMPLSERWAERSVHARLAGTAASHGDRPAVSFQLRSDPRARAVTLSWRAFHREVTQAANLLRRLGVGPGDTVAYLLPNCLEAAVILLAGATAGRVAPINPLLEPEQIAALLREVGAKVLVTLAPFPKSQLAELAARALRDAPGVEVLLEVDLKRYLGPPLSWILPLIRPRATGGHRARVMDLRSAMAAEPGDRLTFDEPDEDRIAALFHTGGTTGMPKVAQHRQSGMLYNGWCGAELLITESDVLICPLPLFHVFAAYPILMSCVFSGAHMVLPTPQGYRGEGVFDNFWKLVERWRVSFMVMVPTAAAALMQRKVDADVGSLKYALCGSAPMPPELFRKFESACGVRILEGYGLTEATCLVSCNPPQGERRIGSVGLPFPYTDVSIRHFDAEGRQTRLCGTDEIGEICVRSIGVFPGYLDPARNGAVFAPDGALRTGDLGRIDADGYLWITGRAKDLIIRGGHNIDPAVIEEALMAHPAVAFVGAVGQPDAYAGELPCAYVELVAGAQVTVAELMDHATRHIRERAAHPKHIEILPELPKTAVGKVFKPELRKDAIRRVLDAAIREAGFPAHVQAVEEDRRLGLVALVAVEGELDRAALAELLGRFPTRVRIGGG
ncbi:MAG: acyl-CoA synthetase [Alphaproteobacteria bacterium]|nr:MAG: acyl-CoA synthetase [Alphaproteobacteria bacterium]